MNIFNHTDSFKDLTSLPFWDSINDDYLPQVDLEFLFLNKKYSLESIPSDKEEKLN